jgi:two-component system phosphate regulon sensor histidine kinase PhoR
MEFGVRARLFLISILVLGVVGLTALFYVQSELEGLRLLLPEQEAARIESYLHKLLAIGTLIGLGVALLMSWISSHIMTRTIHQLLETAKGMLSGHIPRNEVHRRKDELGSIARTLRLMADESETLLNTLTHERDQFRAVLYGMELGVVGLDERNRITLLNRSARDLLDLGDSSLDRPFVEVVREPAVVNLIRNASGNQSTDIEFEMGGASPRVLRARHTPQRASDGSILVLHDVTVVRRLEAARQDFVANVSHELRTPVSIIHGAAENLLDGALQEPETAQQFSETILRNSARLGVLISDLLELSRLDSSSKTMTLSELPIGPLVQTVVANLKSSADERDVRVELEIDPHHQMSADRHAMEQIITNLLDNAIQYGASPGVVRIRTAVFDHAVQIHVIDDGPGIAPSHRTRVFERFFRVDPGRARRDGGTGLGLAIVKHLVLSLGGRIWIEESPEGGCTFILEFTDTSGSRPAG